MLEVENLNVVRGVVPVLHGVSLEVREGEMVALLGGNGAGKTTLLNTLSGLLRCSSGSIRFKGKNIERLSPHQIVELGIAHIPEGRQIFPYLSVKENLLMGACNSRAWRRRGQLLERAYSLFPILKERANQRASLLSGGEQQMLVIARGLMAAPKLLLVDEPSLGLAPIVLSQIYDVLASLPKTGLTVLLSEQNAQYALAIANRGYVLQDGRIVLSGSTAELMENEMVKKAYLGV
ncbi:MAG: ABC transporter ATP-binding protein [Candidatus Methanomethyliaceae archaeon]